MILKSLQKFAYLTFAAACGIAAFPTPPPLPPESPEPPAGTPMSGRELYFKECAVCHGREGEGTERGFPVRKPYRVYATHITRRGRAGNPQFAIPMPAYPAEVLSDRQLVEIWNYLDSLTSATSGEAIFQTYCANCHGRDARGGMSGQPLFNAQGVVTPPDTFDLWVRWGQDDGFYDNRSSYMPRWNQWEISESQLASLRLYLKTLSSQ